MEPVKTPDPLGRFVVSQDTGACAVPDDFRVILMSPVPMQEAPNSMLYFHASGSTVATKRVGVFCVT